MKNHPFTTWSLACSKFKSDFLLLLFPYMRCVCSKHLCVRNIPAEQIAPSTPFKNSMDTGQNSQTSHFHINTKKVTIAENNLLDVN